MAWPSCSCSWLSCLIHNISFLNQCVTDSDQACLSRPTFPLGVEAVSRALVRLPPGAWNLQFSQGVLDFKGGVRPRMGRSRPVFRAPAPRE